MNWPFWAVISLLLLLVAAAGVDTRGNKTKTKKTKKEQNK
jgi:hypothetical protein